MKYDNLKNQVDREAASFKSAEDHATYHLQMAHAVLFEEFEGSDHAQILSRIETLISATTTHPQKLGLINYEGDCLKAIKMFNGKFRIIDQWHEELDIFTRLDLLKFVTGETRIKDSRGNVYYYPDAHTDAKPGAEKLDMFIFG